METLRSLIISILLYLISYALNGQNLDIPSGSSINNDGTVGLIEWQDADTLSIQQNSSSATTVLYKHDGSNLLIAFLGRLQSPSFYSPEVCIDPNNDKSTTFNADDWWFHVSATDCESQGVYGYYGNCQAVRNNWTANPNFSPMMPTDTIEISIPVSNYRCKCWRYDWHPFLPKQLPKL